MKNDRTSTKYSETSYNRLGYRALQIKMDTRSRLNLLKAEMSARTGVAWTQDDVINALLDRHATQVLDDERVPA